jgi:hypothetical protein
MAFGVKRRLEEPFMADDLRLTKVRRELHDYHKAQET